MQAFRSHHQHFGDEFIKAVIDQHVGDFITNFGDGLIPCPHKILASIEYLFEQHYVYCLLYCANWISSWTSCTSDHARVGIPTSLFSNKFYTIKQYRTYVGTGAKAQTRIILQIRILC